MVNKYDDAMEAINAMASVKMAMNRHKGEIEDMHQSKICRLMRDEVDELEQALSEDDLMHVIEEAADVHNFLVAVVHQKIQQYRGRKNAPIERPNETTDHEALGDCANIGPTVCS